MKRSFGSKKLVRTAAAVLAVAATETATVAAAGENGGAEEGRYVTGDFHNHTTCSDGTLSLQKLVDKATNRFGLDWFVQAGHGGNSARNCTLAEDPFEPAPPQLPIPSGGQPASSGHGPNQFWVNTLPGGAAAIKGDVVMQSGVRSMWKWQEIQEFIYPVLENASADIGKPIFTGLEQVVPGHEHSSTGIIDGQLPESGTGNADAMARYEYCFDRADTDRSRGAGNQWDCAVPGGLAVDPVARKLLSNNGTAGHAKTVEGIKSMLATSPHSSYFVPAHLERAGAFSPTGSAGYNIEHLRDFNNAAPDIAFGFESEPGHQAESDRGSYSTGAVGGGTYGGTGVYAAAIGGVWDALLGEGRHWWFFASSDYHNRGSFGPDSRESTADFFPGEYAKDYVLVDTEARSGPGHSDHGPGQAPHYGPQQIVDGLRSGDSFVANGGLIDRLAFVACIAHGNSHEDKAPFREQIARAAENLEAFHKNGCATMGETLEVTAGDDVVVQAVLRDPTTPNNSPYSFSNPSLLQIGVSQPLSAPVLDHVDLIGGKVTGKIDPSDTAHYAGLLGSPAATNPSAALLATFNGTNWDGQTDGWRSFAYRIEGAAADQYVRLRGTNLPPATPFETDSRGNPLLDFGAQGKIACSDPACPSHLRTATGGGKTSSFDVAAWSDLWFYGNPIFIHVTPKPGKH